MTTTIYTVSLTMKKSGENSYKLLLRINCSPSSPTRVTMNSPEHEIFEGPKEACQSFACSLFHANIMWTTTDGSGKMYRTSFEATSYTDIPS